MFPWKHRAKIKKTEWILENSLTQGILKEHQNIINELISQSLNNPLHCKALVDRVDMDHEQNEWMNSNQPTQTKPNQTHKHGLSLRAIWNLILKDWN